METKSDASKQGTPGVSEVDSPMNDESPEQLLPTATAAALESQPMGKPIEDSDGMDPEMASTQEEALLSEGEHEAADYSADMASLEDRSTARTRTLNSVQTLLSKPYEGRRFLIGPELLPKGGRMLITGMSGTGKSTLTLILAACLASKTPLFGIIDTHKGANYGEPKFPISDISAVVYLDYELSDELRAEKRLRPFVDQFPPEFQKNLFFPKHPSLYRLHNQNGEARNEGSYDALEKLVKSTRPDVLVVDPLSSTHSLDENSIAIKQGLNNVDRLIDLYGCAAIVVHHSSTKSRTDRQGKTIEKDAIEEPRGHSSLVDWCDVLVHLKEISDGEVDEDDEPSQLKTIEMVFGKARHCRKPERRRLSVDFAAMQVSPVKKFKKTWGNELKPAKPIG
jgi:KaiC/GvpD/RAD55 family RecA-like ATPase